MATMGFAMWIQAMDLAGTNRLIMIFIGLVAFAMLCVAVAMIVLAAIAFKSLKSLTATADELKIKVLPLIDVAMDISKTSRSVLDDAAPKVKVITDNLVMASDTLAETSKSARAAVAQFDTTIADVNVRAQKQVARVDGMLTSALTATSELAEAIGNGIRVPAQKIAAFAGQARLMAEGIFSRIRAVAAARAGSSSEPE
jgi:ABC-type transporter Mla subunit MlaD